MKKLIIFLFSFLFACNTSSYNAAYNDYYKYQQKYIEALLDNNKKAEILALKELIKCGKFLNFDTSNYEKKLKNLTPKNNIYSKYIKIHSLNPLKLTLPKNYKINHFIIKKNGYKEIFDIKNAITPKFITKKINNITLKIAQFNKNTVRIVFYAQKRFNLNYKISNNKLIAKITNKNPIKKANFLPINTSKKIIVIDPGHGGKDAGGIGLWGKKEKVAVLSIAKKTASILRKKGYIVYLTRTGDYFIPLKKRTHFANQKKADLFISIHCNIAPRHIKTPNGLEIYYLSPTRSERAIRVAKLENKEIKGLNYIDQRVILKFLNKDRIIDSHKLGIDIKNSILKNVRKKGFYLKDGGVRPAPFWVLVGTQMPSILIETGYLTNPRDAKNLFNPLFQWQMAKGIAEGIDNYFRKNP